MSNLISLVSFHPFRVVQNCREAAFGDIAALFARTTRHIAGAGDTEMQDNCAGTVKVLAQYIIFPKVLKAIHAVNPPVSIASGKVSMKASKSGWNSLFQKLRSFAIISGALVWNAAASGNRGSARAAPPSYNDLKIANAKTGESGITVNARRLTIAICSDAR
ncbi:hypothetical protein FA13DRAFT_1785696 [Coprinellus micaceus]|uniref:Uncharacterized protein n=1 Tax=Coprinellus micaceus TaxID=71717 RepID=A0A4Y7TW10_COPMI|nr:hypothetical protein FA13DRAFT_1785696 [Coprinellus micaceus]